MLRVIAGEHGGRKLYQPNAEISRPTKDRTKESVFSSIQFQIPGSLVLDLFAGSGSLAIEAISRGAMKAIAVDMDKKAVEVINKNRAMLRLNNLDVRKSDVIEFVKRAKGMKFKFIFMDPPYKEIGLYNKTLKTINDSNILEDTGLVVLETANPNEIEIPEGMTIQKSKSYGKTNILLIANNI